LGASIDTNVKNTNAYFGQGTDIAAGTAPSFAIQGQTAHDVTSAFSKVDQGITAANNALTQTKSDLTTNINANAQNISKNATNIASASEVINQNRADFEAANGQLASYFGGGASYDKASGQFTAPNYTIQKQTAGDIGSAFKLVDSGLGAVTQQINQINSNITNGATGPIQRQSDGSLALMDADNKTAAPQILNNVADGKTANQAVNFGQLDAQNKSLTDTINQTNTALTQTINTNDTNQTKALAQTKSDLTTNINANAQNISKNTSDIASANKMITQNRAAFDDTVKNINAFFGSGDISAGAAPNFKIQSKTANNVTDAFSAVSDTFDNVDKQIININSQIAGGSVGPIQRQSDGSLALMDADNKTAAPQLLNNVADGKTANQAVNFGQLDAQNKSLTDAITTNDANQTKALNQAKTDLSGSIADNAKTVSAYFGKDIDIASGKGPSFTVQGKTASDVETAFGNVSDIFDSVDKQISQINANITNGAMGPVQRVNDGDVLSLTGKGGSASAPGNAQTLTNIADGKNALDAVNFGQLDTQNKALTKNIADTDTKLTGSINSANENIAANAAGVSRNTASITQNREAFDAANAQLASYLGGGAGYDKASGQFTAPSYHLHGGTVNNAGDAFSQLDNSIGSLSAKITNATKQIPVQRVGDNMLALMDEESEPGARQSLSNVAAGRLDADSSEAVNGSQLFETNSRIDAANAEIADAKGKIDIANQKIGGLDGRVTNIETKITNLGNAAENAVTYDTDNGKRANSITLMGEPAAGGKPAAPVAIHNLAGGAIAKGSTDAVNGGQLSDTKDEIIAYADTAAGGALTKANAYTDQQINSISEQAMEGANIYTDKRFNQLNGEVHRARQEARSAAAIGLAAASLRFDQNPGKISVAMGGGGWRGEGAGAVGVGWTSFSGKVRVNMTGTIARSNMGFGGGASFTLN